MFIRRTQTGRSSTGERYESHRLVQSERHGSKVRRRSGRRCVCGSMNCAMAWGLRFQ